MLATKPLPRLRRALALTLNQMELQLAFAGIALACIALAHGLPWLLSLITPLLSLLLEAFGALILLGAVYGAACNLKDRFIKGV